MVKKGAEVRCLLKRHMDERSQISMINWYEPERCVHQLLRSHQWKGGDVHVCTSHQSLYMNRIEGSDTVCSTLDDRKTTKWWYPSPFSKCIYVYW